MMRQCNLLNQPAPSGSLAPLAKDGQTRENDLVQVTILNLIFQVKPFLYSWSRDVPYRVRIKSYDNSKMLFIAHDCQ